MRKSLYKYSIILVVLLMVGTLPAIGLISQKAYASGTWVDMRGPDNGSASDIEWDSVNNVLYRASGRGVWKYDGTTWTDTGGDISSSYIRSLEWVPENNTLFAGDLSDGVWEYDGTTWVNTGGGTFDEITYALEWDSTNDLLYAGTPYGIWSYDGDDWVDVSGDLSGLSIYTLLWDATRDTLVAGTGEGVWTYDGDTWTAAGGDLEYSQIRSLAWDPTRNIIYVGTSSVGNRSVWTYDGTEFTNIGGDVVNTYYCGQLEYDSENDILYAGTSYHGVWKYDGTTWTDTGGSMSLHMGASMAYDHTSNVLYFGTLFDGVWKYNGTNWADAGGGVSHQTIYSQAWDSSLNYLYVACDDGVWKYDGTGWSSTGGFISRSQTFSLAYDPTNDLLYAGTINYGICKYDGTSWTDIDSDLDIYSRSLVWDPNHNLLYAATGDGVWKYDGTDWTDTGGDVSSYSIRSLAYDLEHDLLYAGLYNHGVWKYDGTTWTNTNGGISTFTVSSIVWDPAGDALYAGLSDERVWKYDGSSWAPLGSGLPNGGVHALAYNSKSNRLYAGMSRKGVYELNGASWESTGGEISDESVYSLSWDPEKRFLFAGTTSLGVWRLENPPTICSVSPDTAIQGQTLDIDIVGCGTNFIQGESELEFSGGGITVNDTTVNDQTSLTANITVAADAPKGTRDVNVITEEETPEPLAGGFTVQPTEPVITSLYPTWGKIGSIVEIKGNSFGAARGTSYVKFGTRKCTSSDYISWSENEIRVKVPAWTIGKVPVKVTTEGGTSNGKYFVVVGCPFIKSISPECGPPGTLVTVIGENFGDDRNASGNTSGGSTSYVSFSGVQATEYPSWTDTKIEVIVPPEASGGTVEVVTSTGSSSEETVFSVSSPTWYLAEGSTKWGFNCWINIENPNNSDKTAEITFMLSNGQNISHAEILPAMSQTYIDVVEVIGEQDFSTKVECAEGDTIAVDRTMLWTTGPDQLVDAHTSIGVTAPAEKWYLPEGSSKWGFETWLLIQNPGDENALCTLTYMIEGKDPVQVKKEVPARSRRSFFMADDIGFEDASIMVESNTPVIPERAMYRNNRREGHDSIGTTTPSNDYYLAEGSTDWGFTTYILVQNPNPVPTDVSITYMTPEGPLSEPWFTMPANSRKTIRANDNYPGKDLSTHVHGTNPIIAERAMYWNNGTGEACHDSIGLSAPHSIFYLPDGANYYIETDEYWFQVESWTLVQNPNDCQIEIELSYLGGDGLISSSTHTLPAQSRKSFFLGDGAGEADASVMVECLTPEKKIMVERSIYFFYKEGGAVSIGGYSDID